MAVGKFIRVIKGPPSLFIATIANQKDNAMYFVKVIKTKYAYPLPCMN